MFKKNQIVVAPNIDGGEGYHLKLRVIEDQISSDEFSGRVLYSDAGDAGYHIYEQGHECDGWTAKYFVSYEATLDFDPVYRMESALDKLEKKLC